MQFQPYETQRRSYELAPSVIVHFHCICFPHNELFWWEESQGLEQHVREWIVVFFWTGNVQ